ncbi:MAG: DUF427 domain-containing protein [Alphaproteobacteria bacterium]|nr:DUF427 domain-containing protein [Alphaproteobacteria bacterium]TAD91530.1 MAG: DUF427 domain-containing protein [Alphaproteobacteria bacterium]
MESVLDHPRPPRLERTTRRIIIEHRGVVIADTTNAWVVSRAGQAPSYYLPPVDVRRDLLRQVARQTFCEWKGRAVYWDLVSGEEIVSLVGWSYPRPVPGFAAIANHLAFYAAPFDSVTVDGVPVTAQPGGLYPGWITADSAASVSGIPAAAHC